MGAARMSMKFDRPIRFEHLSLEKVWGGRGLEECPGLELPAGKNIGEVWEVVDRSGENSKAVEGAEAGRSLRELMQADARAILGSVDANERGYFPLLVKFIDAAEALSIQVHPNDESALRMGPKAEAKTEAWYILSAADDAVIYAGIKPDTDPEEFSRVARSGKSIVHLMQSWSVSAGDCFLIEGGTVHAIGGGVVLLEVQQNSDTTYRIYDWDREPEKGVVRKMHVEEALAVAHMAPIAGPRKMKPIHGRQVLVETAYFSMAGIALAERSSETETQASDIAIECFEQPFSDSFRIYTVTSGCAEFSSDSGHTTLFKRGDTWLIPAALGSYRIASRDGECTLVEIGPGA